MKKEDWERLLAFEWTRSQRDCLLKLKKAGERGLALHHNDALVVQRELHDAELPYALVEVKGKATVKHYAVEKRES